MPFALGTAMKLQKLTTVLLKYHSNGNYFYYRKT